MKVHLPQATCARHKTACSVPSRFLSTTTTTTTTILPKISNLSAFAACVQYPIKTASRFPLQARPSPATVLSSSSTASRVLPTMANAAGSSSPDGSLMVEAIHPDIQDASKFQTRLNDLPREIFDMIESLVTSTHIASHQRLYRLGQQPDRSQYVSNIEILHLGKAIRKSHAQEFFGQRTFEFDTFVAMCSWLASVAVEHRGFIGNIKLVRSRHARSLAIGPRFRAQFGDTVHKKLIVTRALSVSFCWAQRFARLQRSREASSSAVAS